MSERGVFAVDRGIWDHDLLASAEPFSRREAWLWLVSEAAWKPHRRRLAGKPIDVQRGQVAASLRFIASKWLWSEPRVRRFLAALISDHMVDAKTDAGVTVITICKYDEYQRVSLPGDATPRSDSDAGATQERRKVEDREYKEDSEAIASGTDAPQPPLAKPVYTDSKHELWGEAVPILVALGVPERSARANIGRWLRDAKEDAQAVLGAIQRARDHRVIEPIPWITRALKTNGKSPHADNRSLSAVARAAAERAAELAAGTDLCDDDGGPPVRLLPQRQSA